MAEHTMRVNRALKYRFAGKAFTTIHDRIKIILLATWCPFCFSVSNKNLKTIPVDIALMHLLQYHHKHAPSQAIPVIHN
jgi:hypothetical protein